MLRKTVAFADNIIILYVAGVVVVSFAQFAIETVDYIKNR